VRKAIRVESALGKQAQEAIAKDEDVPDDVLVDLCAEAVAATKGGWILDGFPRSTAQAEALVAKGVTPTIALVIDVPDEVLLARCTERRLDPVTGTVYNLKTDPPPDEEVRLFPHRTSHQRLSFQRTPPLERHTIHPYPRLLRLREEPHAGRRALHAAAGRHGGAGAGAARLVQGREGGGLRGLCGRRAGDGADRNMSAPHRCSLGNRYQLCSGEGPNPTGPVRSWTARGSRTRSTPRWPASWRARRWSSGGEGRAIVLYRVVVMRTRFLSACVSSYMYCIRMPIFTIATCTCVVMHMAGKNSKNSTAVTTN
jgi:adenylate kinase family enzyme